MNDWAELDTPCLLLDKTVLAANASRFQQIADHHDVVLRPHLKTSKSVDVARVLTENRHDRPVTVSTLAEAEYFAAAGFSDILYAVGIVPAKFDRVAQLTRSTGARVLMITDSVQVVKQADEFVRRTGVSLEFLIEIDCGDRRGGVLPDSEALLDVARIINQSRGVACRGVMTHAGHSYATSDPDAVASIAEEERRAVVHAAQRLDRAGIDCAIVSVGSTPTVAFAHSLKGVTEVRCGVYAFFDLDQYGRGVCGYDDLALSVLATIIGHNRDAGLIIVDAGGLALSKDISARRFLPDAGYGYVCMPDDLSRCEGLSINAVNQEHGKINVEDSLWYDRLPVGSRVRILPNHACFTAAAYPGYHVVEDNRRAAWWGRHNGW